MEFTIIPKMKDLHLLYIIGFMDLFAVGLIFPVFAVHLKQLGASNFTIGLLGSFYSIIQIISGPVIGSWSDTRDRKSVMMITSIVCALSYGWLGVTNSILCISILRVILGIAKHTQSLCKAEITALLPPKDRAGAFGNMAAFGSFGFIAGPLIGGLVVELENGFKYVCLLTALLFVINTGLTWRLSTLSRTDEQRHDQQRFKHEVLKTFSNLINADWSHHWESFIIRFLFGIASIMYFSIQSVYLREYFHLTPRYIGYTISYIGTIGTVSAFFVDWMTRRFYTNDENCSKRLTHFFAILTLTFVAIYLTRNFTIYLIFLIPFSICRTILRIVTMEKMLKNSVKDNRGSLSGISNSIMSVARFSSPLMSGVVQDYFGDHLLILFISFITILATVICSIHKNDKIKSQ